MKHWNSGATVCSKQRLCSISPKSRQLAGSDLQSALEAAELSLKLRREVHDQIGIAHSLLAIGSIHNALGQPAEAQKALTEALQIVQRRGHRVGECRAYLEMMAMYANLDDSGSGGGSSPAWSCPGAGTGSQGIHVPHPGRSGQSGHAAERVRRGVRTALRAISDTGANRHSGCESRGRISCARIPRGKWARQRRRSAISRRPCARSSSEATQSGPCMRFCSWRRCLPRRDPWHAQSNWKPPPALFPVGRNLRPTARYTLIRWKN